MSKKVYPFHAGQEYVPVESCAVMSMYHSKFNPDMPFSKTSHILCFRCRQPLDISLVGQSATCSECGLYTVILSSAMLTVQESNDRVIAYREQCKEKDIITKETETVRQEVYSAVHNKLTTIQSN